jgi:hypothetical protein
MAEEQDAWDLVQATRCPVAPHQAPNKDVSGRSAHRAQESHPVVLVDPLSRIKRRMGKDTASVAHSHLEFHNGSPAVGSVVNTPGDRTDLRPNKVRVNPGTVSTQSS